MRIPVGLHCRSHLTYVDALLTSKFNRKAFVLAHMEQRGTADRTPHS